MKRFLFFLVLLTFAYGCQRKCTSQMLEQRFLDKNKWLVTANRQELSGLILPELNYTHSNCWTELEEPFLLSPEEKGLFYNAITVDSAAYHVVEKTGLVRGNGTFDIIHKGKPLVIRLCFSETYVCQDGQWKLFARHAAKL